MTLKERVYHAVNHEETGYVPYSVTFSDRIYEKMQEFYHDPDFLESFDNHVVDVWPALLHRS